MTIHPEALPTRAVERMFNLDDVHVRQDGTGRVVEAYAAAFNVRAEIMDQDGHYNEVLAPTSFDRTIQHKGVEGFTVLFNHGRTVDGEPNPAATMPIGVPLEVRADEKGVFTATRYLDNPLADQVLDAVRNRALKAQSFAGRFTKSAKTYPDGRRSGSLPLITRQEIDMREYGPAVFAAYPGATILGTRAEMFIRALLDTPPDRRLEWLSQFEGLTTPLEADPVEDLHGTPSGPADPTEDGDPRDAHSTRSIRTRAHQWRVDREMERMNREEA